MENKNKYLIITFIFIAVIIITGTFAWLSYRSKKTSLVFTVGDMNNMQVTLSPYQIDAEIDPELDYTDSDYVNVTATNNRDEAMNYTLYYDISEIDSALQSTDFKYTIERSIDNGSTYTEYITGDFSAANTTDNFITLDEDIPAETTYKYRVYVWLDGYTNPNTGIEGATFKGELKADIVGLARAYLTEDIATTNAFYKEDTYREKIVSASFVDYINVPANAVTTYDLKSSAKHPITAWLVPGEETDTYKLYIGANEKIYGKTLYRLFYGMKRLKNLNFSNLDTSDTENMASMFNGCSSLISLDLSGFDTSKVSGSANTRGEAVATGMGSMFHNCTSLASLDLSNFNTSNVASMYSMFWNCSSLTNLDLSNFNTVNVNGYGMNSMFYGCSNLTELNLSSFDTRNVTNMTNMFFGCSKLESINISSFNTSNVTIMSSMFRNCSSLISLDLSNFNTSNVTNLSNMFNGCSSLVNLNISSFNTSNVTIMIAMFSGCSSLTSLDLSNFNTSNVTTMNTMFAECSKLSNIYVSDLWDTSNVANDNSSNKFLFVDDVNLPNYSGITDISKAHYGEGGYLTYKAYNGS